MKKQLFKIFAAGIILGTLLSGLFLFDVVRVNAADDYSGIYVIRSTNDYNMVMDVCGGTSAVQGAKVIQWGFHGGANQQWKITRQTDGSYTLQSLLPSGYLMDVTGASTSNGAEIIQWPSNNGENQKWIIAANGDGTVTIQSKNSGYVLDVYGGQKTAGTKIIQWASHGGANQKWILESLDSIQTVSFASNGGTPVAEQSVSNGSLAVMPAAPTRLGYSFAGWYADSGLTDPWDFAVDKVTGDLTLYAKWVMASNSVSLNISQATIYTLQSKSSNLFLENAGGFFIQDVYEGNAASKAGQQWQFVAYGGNFLIMNRADGMVLEVPGGSTVQGTELAMASLNEGLNQQWQVLEAGTLKAITGYPLPGKEYVIRSAANGLFADIPGASATAGTRLIQWAYNGDNNQIFTIAPGLSIIGTSEVSEAKMLSYILANYGPQPVYNAEGLTFMVSEYYRLEKIYGVRADIALAQAIHETGWYRYGGLVLPDQFNFAGIYATGTYPDGFTGTESIYGADPAKVSLVVGEKAARFSSVKNGVEAHVQHLYGYAKGEVSVDSNKDGIYELGSTGDTLASPRYRLLEASKLGSAPILQALAGKWAVPGTGYSVSLMKYLYNAYNY